MTRESNQQNLLPSDLSDRIPDSRFLNRELSWIEFNRRVLEQALDRTLPLLERAKFLAITSSNLDEFMMVRVGSLKLQYEENPLLRDPSCHTVEEQLNAVSEACRKLVHQQTRLYVSSMEEALRNSGIRRVKFIEENTSAARAAEQRLNEIEAVLSPQTVATGASFPLLMGLSLHICVRLRKAKSHSDVQTNVETSAPEEYAIIPIGKAIDRVIWLPSDSGHSYILLEDLISSSISRFFPGREIIESCIFRITRNADIELREDSASDLMIGMEEVLESRRRSRVIRLEHEKGISESMLYFLSSGMHLTSNDLYPIDGPLDLTHLFCLHELRGFDSLRDEPWPAQKPSNIDPQRSMFSNISKRDHLLVHPYESFDPVVRLIEEASADDDVLAIKQILYRTSRKSPIVAALKNAARNGKYVSVVVELKARFDEARNIEWAREMERAGVQVIYGIRGLKTHAKLCIIVRREPQGIVRYMHFGTGNYNEVTANLYSDISLLTCKDELGIEATAFFNAISGNSQLKNLRQLATAPDGLRPKLLNLIEHERTRCQQGQKGQIIAKLNSLVDPEIIEALYLASQAGVKIQLNVRGVCCLRPNVAGISENISVVSIVDRFLEHARIFYFARGGTPQIYISSADWMPRNLDRRVELLVPIHDSQCLQKITSTLHCYFKDQASTWVMQSDGSYTRPSSHSEPFRAQRHLYETAKRAVIEAKNSRLGNFETLVPKVDP